MIKKEIIQSYIASIIRHGLTALGVALLAHHVDATKVNNLTSLLDPSSIAEELMAGAAIVWSLYHKKNTANTINDLVIQVGDPNTTAPAKGAMSMAPSVSKVPCAIIGLLFLSSCLAQAQVPSTTNLINNATFAVSLQDVVTNINTNALNVANDVIAWLKPIIPYLTNKQVVLDIAGTYYKGQLGAIADLQVPLNANLSLGGGGAYIANQWFITLISTKFGANFTVPLINKEATWFAETGMAIPIKSWKMENQSATGLFTQWDLGRTSSTKQPWYFVIEGGVIKETSLSGVAEFGGASINHSFK